MSLNYTEKLVDEWSATDIVKYFSSTTGCYIDSYGWATKHIARLLHKFDPHEIKNTIDACIVKNIHLNAIQCITPKFIEFVNNKSIITNEEKIYSYIKELEESGLNSSEIINRVLKMTSNQMLINAIKIKYSPYKQFLTRIRHTTKCAFCNDIINKKDLIYKIDKTYFCFKCGCKMDIKCPICLGTGKINNKKCNCLVQKTRAIALKEANIDVAYWFFSLENAIKNTKQYILNFDDLDGWCKNIESNIIQGRNLFLYDGSSNGKTSIAYCIGKRALLKYKLSVKVISFNNLIKMFLTMFDKDIEIEKTRLNSYDLLIIDSFGLTNITNTDKIANLFLMALNELKPTKIITSDIEGVAIKKMYNKEVADALYSKFHRIRFTNGTINKDFSKNKNIQNITSIKI